MNTRFVESTEAINLDQFPRPQRPARWMHRVEFRILCAVQWLFEHLSRQQALRVGAMLGSALYAVDWKHRPRALHNLRIAFPEKSDVERRSIFHRSCRNLGRSVAEAAQLGTLDATTVGRYVHLDDPERWRQAVDRPGGAIIVTAHFGSWELFAYAQGLLGRPVTIVHKSFANQLVDRVVNDLRTRAGTRLLAKKRAARDALRALRDGAVLVTPVDQNQKRQDGVFVTFFGHLACTTPGPARLAAHTGVPVVPAFLVRDGESDQHRLVVLPDLEMVHTSDRAADVVVNTQRCSDVVERMIREHPDQWIWFHRRWRTRPEGEAEFY